MGPSTESVSKGSAAGPRATRPRSWPESDDGTEAGRRAQAAAEIGSGGQPDLAAGQRYRRAARGAAARLGGIPRIEGGAEDFIEGIGPGAEFRRVRFGEDDGAVAFQGLDHHVGARWHVVGEDGGAKGRPHPGHLVEVLDGDGKPGQPARCPACRVVRVHATSGFAGALGAQGGQGVEGAVGGLDARQGGIDGLQGADLGTPKKVHHGPRRQLEEFGHGPILYHHLPCRGIRHFIVVSLLPSNGHEQTAATHARLRPPWGGAGCRPGMAVAADARRRAASPFDSACPCPARSENRAGSSITSISTRVKGVGDYNCGKASYDGHKGGDFAIRDMGVMRDGIPVLAAAKGTVAELRDGMADVDFNLIGGPSAVKGKECGNGVTLRHRDGWSTQYCHLRRGSVSVKNGQNVEAGARLGMVGHSGRAMFPPRAYPGPQGQGDRRSLHRHQPRQAMRAR